ncbi:MAG: haloacid dehalogenase-like hydrolase [Chromatiaceae bacterium]|nr:haloacid dehalogenase-like hydrolase [Chromatiaceae bacterium]MBP6733420.1 haloacid dehalogenase-like hydrolase [Chromatiaceae bacterium]MBP8283137.1 haloacid dehalogenase-like hydrolase [Chromatiaceae bacterium]MBP8288489.1 haloacid dehalogenase-like hydrolase [Chromatiaceae bacterium]
MKYSVTKVVIGLLLFASAAFAADPLPSWNDGAAKQGIMGFVEKVTQEGSAAFVPPAERIATFDNDGTLWSEQPVPVQLYFALDRVKALAPQHPEWKTQEPFASLLKGDVKTALASGDHALLEIVMATHAGMTTVEFEQIVKDWIATAKHPKTGRLFTEMTYQPMLELLAYLRANGFKNYIVSGGGIEFMRPWAGQVYGIPPEQIIGSSIQTRFEMRDDKAVLVRLPELNFNDDKDGKPIAINRHIGRRPIAAFGNSRGDKEMLEYTRSGGGPHFELLVLHDDAAREYAYGPARGLPDVKLGAFTSALDEQAKKEDWVVVSMKTDWKQVFPVAQPAVTAIDILLEPDATMLQHAAANNARLLKVNPQGFALDAEHRPHITLIQRFVRTADLDKVYAAAGQVLADANANAMTLEAFKYYYAPGKDVGVAGIVARPTPELLQLQQDLLAAVAPFTVETGTIAAFTAAHDDRALDAAIIEYVSTFVPKYSGEHFSPHVSTGVASRDYLDKMLAEPFAPFTFSPAGAAVYQLGPFGTAAKKLKEWDLKP